MRRLLVQLMTRCAQQEIGTLLPDLPGSNESLTPLEETSMADWRAALQSCSRTFGGITHIAAFRGGCLIDDIAQDLPAWRLAPVAGKSLLRTLLRTRLAADKESGKNTDMAALSAAAAKEPVNLAGHVINPQLFAQLEQATAPDLAHVRTAQLASRARPGEIALAGSALWLRAEPDDDPELVAAIATDLASWVAA